MMSSTSNQETRATKRQRVSDEDSESLSTPTPSPRGTPWFDDGNLILQNHDGVRFKVYKGLLALHSTVFSDMLSLPQPLTQELVEGCPLVLLSESSTELTIFLQLMFGQIGRIGDSDGVSFDQLSIMLRLGKKYDDQRLRDNAIRILRGAFPDTLQAYDNSNDGHLLSTATVLELAWLAFSEDIYIVLPILCYVSATLEELPGLWRDGHRRKNGELFETSLEFNILLATGITSAFFEQSKINFTWVNSTESKCAPNCITRGKCEKALDEIARSYHSMRDQGYDIGISPLYDLGWWPPTNGLCSICIAGVEEQQLKDRIKFWEALPSFFGLPPWEELRRKHALVYS